MKSMSHFAFVIMELKLINENSYSRLFLLDESQQIVLLIQHKFNSDKMTLIEMIKVVAMSCDHVETIEYDF